jgi:predicted PurR-regulated permease PerM
LSKIIIDNNEEPKGKKQPVLHMKNPYMRIGLILLMVVLFFVLIYLMRSTLMPFMIAFIIAYILDPAVDFFERHKLSRDFGIVIVFLLIAILLVSFVLLIFPTILTEFSILIKKGPQYLELLQVKFIPAIEAKFDITLPHKLPELIDKLKNYVPQLQELGAKLVTPLKNFFLSTFSGIFSFVMTIVNLTIIPVFAFYLLRSFDHIIVSLQNYIPFAYRHPVNRIMSNIDEVLSSFIRGQITVCLILGVLYSTGLLIIGTPLAVVIGLSAGIANIVPYLGLCIGIFPALFFSFLEHQDWQHPLGVVIVFIVVQLLEGTVITPKIVGDRLGLNPVVILLGILVFGNIFGFFGILMAVPLTATLKVLFKELHDKYLKKLLFVFINQE